MVKRALTLLTSILIALPLLMPFNIYASGYVVTGSDVVIGVNADIYDYDKSYYSQLVQLRSGGSSQWLADSNIGYQQYGIVRYEFVLNKEYLGYIWIKVSFPSGTTQSFKFYVNGDKFYWFTRYDPVYNQDMATSFEVTSVSLVEKEDNQMSSTDLTNFLNELIANQEELIVSTSDIYDETVIIGNNTVSMSRVLSEFYEYVSVYQKQSLDTINNYLSFISEIRQYNMPLEYYNSVSYLLDKYNPISFNQYYQFNIPIFDVPAGDRVTDNLRVQRKGLRLSRFVIVILTNSRLYSASWQNYYIPSQEIEVQSFVEKIIGNYYMYTIICNSAYTDASKDIYFTINGNYKMNILIYNLFPTTDNYLNVSNDVALLTGIPNEITYNLGIITNGTTASQSAADSSQSANSQLQTDSNTLFTQEDNFKSDMNNAMQNVNTTFRLQDMGTKFVSSAQWVRTQYEHLTNNTPFASLITFSLITGLALILLGKVYK